MIIDGKKISTEIKDELKEQVAKLKAEGVEVTLAVVKVGEDPAPTTCFRRGRWRRLQACPRGNTVAGL